MRKLFEFVQQIGRYRVLIGTKDIVDGAITFGKLAAALREVINNNTPLFATRNVTTFADVSNAVQNGRIVVVVNNGCYYNLTSFKNGVFRFTQIDDDGNISYITLSSSGWGAWQTVVLEKDTQPMIEERPINDEW